MNASKRQKPFFKEWRLHRGLTQEEVANKLGTSKGRISELETGRARYNQDVLERLARLFGCAPADLLATRPGDYDETAAVLARLPNDKREIAKRLIKALEGGGEDAPK